MLLLVTDVFVSYASEDREQAQRLAHAFDQQGWSVWWDRKIVAGQEFDQAIEYELESAKSVVVLWSSRSIASEWVRNEAAVGAQRGVLVPAMIESVKLPLEFRRKQTADLTGWNGELSHSGFRSVCEGVASIIGRAPPQLPDRATPARGHRLRWSGGDRRRAPAMLRCVRPRSLAHRRTDAQNSERWLGEYGTFGHSETLRCRSRTC